MEAAVLCCDERDEMDRIMKPMTATTRATIYGGRTGWSLNDQCGSTRKVMDVTVNLEIQSDGGNGFHLVIAPDGFFTADTWHETLQSAIETSQELFGIDPAEWQVA